MAEEFSVKFLGVLSILGGFVAMVSGYNVETIFGNGSFIGGIFWVLIGFIILIRGGSITNLPP